MIEFKKDFFAHCNPKILEFYETRNGHTLDWAEYQLLTKDGASSYDRKVLFWYMTTPCLIQEIQNLMKLGQIGETPDYHLEHTYNDAILKTYLPELLRRLEENDTSNCVRFSSTTESTRPSSPLIVSRR